MVDPRLNSVHLEGPRREAYRRAREALLGARGYQTLAAEHPSEAPSDPHSSHTLVQPPSQNAPPGVRFWLMDRESVYPLKVGVNTVGRAPENDVVLPDTFVSRRHCVIVVHTSDRCELFDTASKNGTYVNGRRLEGSLPLNPGDEIRMCDRHLVFMGRSGTADAPLQSPTLAG